MARDDRGPKGPRKPRQQTRSARPRPRAGGKPEEQRPLRPARPRPPRMPQLPEERPRLRRDVYGDLRAASRPDQVDDVVKAFGAASEALEEGDLARATELLAWAKHAASRSGVVREALGLARYHAGDYAAAHAELLAYRRLTGRADQNHVLADCARATGRGDRVAEYVAEMEAGDVHPERVVEGWIVLAATKADRGDFLGALAVLERADLRPAQVQPWHPRLWYYAADLSTRAGDEGRAREYLEAVVAVDSDYLDAADRLAALD